MVGWVPRSDVVNARTLYKYIMSIRYTIIVRLCGDTHDWITGVVRDGAFEGDPFRFHQFGLLRLGLTFSNRTNKAQEFPREEMRYAAGHGG